jgi:putative ABC transport system substrate-binding protein
VRLLSTRLATAAVLLVLAVSLAPVAAQSPEKVPRVGFLGPRTRSNDAGFLDAFLQGLRDLGWVEGKTIVIEYRWAEGKSDRLPDLAAELVRLKVDVILAGSGAVAVAVKNATETIPIVMATAGDPVGLGLVTSLARPGGNVTGLSFSVGTDIVGKWLELLKETVPKARRVAVLSNPANPSQALAIENVIVAARAVGVQLQLLEARGPNQFDNAFAAMARERAEALLVVLDPFFGFHRSRLSALAAKSRIPAMYGSREYAEAGGLMSYGANFRHNFHRSATYVDKILKGAKPADLPIEQPVKFELVINLKTAKLLGLTIPPSLLLRADQVIE